MSKPMAGTSARFVVAPLASMLLMQTSLALAQDTSGGQPSLPTVVVTATRSETLAFDTPASIDAVSLRDPAANTPGINPSEYLAGIPGLVARDRQNYAQDEQISIRGFGARSTFGVRGVRLYIDGIPATLPDGQGQVSGFNLGSGDRIEVLRGPFSALYGNSSGGVIQIFTAEGSSPPEFRGALDGGSYGTYRIDLNARGSNDALNYNLDFSHFYTDGYRGHGRAQRENGNAKVDIHLDGDRKLTFLANTVALPNADDPLGLTRAQFDTDPRQPQPVAVQFNTRKSVHQNQIGSVYEQAFSDHNSVRLLGYYGQRDVQQFQSIPIATQLRPTSPGGVIDLDGAYYGTDLRWINHSTLADRPLDLTAGVNYDRQNQLRQGYNNFVGTELGVQGALRRNENDDVYNLDEYVQGNWNLAERWLINLGARHSDVNFSSVDHYITATNADDSGSIDYSATTPIAGVLYRASAQWHLYASYGHAFETPTFNELGYRPDGGAGINFGLVPARSRNGELGSKLLIGERGEFDAALFRANTSHELAVATSSGGRTTYQNIDSARRQGVELKFDYALAERWHFQAAYTYLDAKFTSSFLTCPAASTCTTPNTLVASGARIPGVPESNFYAGVHYGAAQGWNGSLEFLAASNVAVNDLNTQYAPGYGVMNASVGYGFDLSDAQVNTFVRLNNLFDHSYVGSVIVNESNGRYYEPAPTRSIFAGVQVKWKH